MIKWLRSVFKLNPKFVPHNGDKEKTEQLVKLLKLHVETGQRLERLAHLEAESQLYKRARINK